MPTCRRTSIGRFEPAWHRSERTLPHRRGWYADPAASQGLSSSPSEQGENMATPASSRSEKKKEGMLLPRCCHAFYIIAML